MSENLKLWDSVARVPKEHLKPFDNGKFKGTAIKPMWSIKIMTENFGPFGTGWGVASHKFTLVPASDNETMVYCEIDVWYGNKEARASGVGGDWAVRGGKGQDEGFKKAYTDALTNALKHIGVAADIHMGLWDGNKYVDEAETPPPTKTETRPEFQRMCEAVHGFKTWDALDAWRNLNAKAIAALNTDLTEKLKHTIKAKEFCLDIVSHETVESLAEWKAVNDATLKALPEEAWDFVARQYADHKKHITQGKAAA